MKRRHFLFGSFLLTLWLNRPAWAQSGGDELKPLQLVNPDYPYNKVFEILAPGTYVLTEDQIQPKLSGGGHVGPKGGYMLNIYCGSVTIDLQGHTLGADFGVAGVALSARQNREFAKRFPKQHGPASLDSRFVTLRNGTIDLARGERTLTALKFADRWYFPDQQTGQRVPLSDDRRASAPVPLDVTYIRNEYLFEHLTVKALSMAMAVEGSHTVIRNCVIEAAGVAAIFIAGPNVLIENCEIRLRPLDRNALEATRHPLRAAIILRDGQGAVIRNNRIRVDSGGEPADTHCILIRDGAGEITIEGNTFINVEGEPVTLLDGATATVKDNQRERHWGFW